MLIVDDNEADIVLIREFLKDCPVPIHFAVAGDGETALDILHSTATDLVLLDLGIPKLDGHEVPRRVRLTGHLKMPIIVISSSQNPEDVHEVFRNGANRYVPKRPEMLDYQEEVQLHIQPWIETISRKKNE